MDIANNENNKKNKKIITTPTLETYFFLDWDNTVYPSSFCNKNAINVKKNDDFENYKLFFIELDNTIYNILEKLNSLGIIYIITNASLTWVRQCISVLKNTKKFIMINKIRIISARDIYFKITTDPLQWKIKTFQNVIDIIMKNNNNNHILNIISIGDSTFEYDSLLNLDNYLQKKYNNNNYLLKSIKFIDEPSFEEIIDQLNVLFKNIEVISNEFNYIDIKFDINKK